VPDVINAQQLVDRIQKNLGVPWKTSTTDVFCAGSPDVPVTGIATTFAPSLEVLRRASAAKKNMIISPEHVFFSHGGAYSQVPPDLLEKDAACRSKREFIQKNNLVLWRFSENWHARKIDGELRGLAIALGWDNHHKPDRKTGEEPYHPGDELFVLPTTSLKEMAIGIRNRLKARGMRVIGDPQTKVAKVALKPGMLTVPALQKTLADFDVDVIITGEPIEWEAAPYIQDMVTAGRKKGMIIVGLEVSQDPGSGELAKWLKTFIPEVPIEWISTGEPVWVPGLR
jgi:putative NIF3 family GTP cyclohydrolase 1 type 2